MYIISFENMRNTKLKDVRTAWSHSRCVFILSRFPHPKSPLPSCALTRMHTSSFPLTHLLLLIYYILLILTFTIELRLVLLILNSFNHLRFFLGKNRVMQVALGKSEEDEYKPNLHTLSEVCRLIELTLICLCSHFFC